MKPIARTFSIAAATALFISAPSAANDFSAAENRIPLVWNDRLAAYVMPDGKRPLEITASQFRIVAPYPNIIWNLDRRLYETLDGNPLPLVRDSMKNRMVIPIEAIDPFRGLQERLQLIHAPDGKIPIFFDPQKRAYIDRNGHEVALWNYKTHLLIKPLPNLVWSVPAGSYVTRDGQPFTDPGKGSGWGGLAVKGFDRRQDAADQHFLSAPILPDGIRRIPARLQLLDKLNLFERGLADSDLVGGQGSRYDLADIISRMRGGLEGRVLREAPEQFEAWAKRSSAEVSASSKAAAIKRPHVSERAGFGMNVIRASTAFQHAQSQITPPAGVGGGVEFNRDLLNQWKSLASEGIQMIGPGNVNNAQIQNYTDRYMSLAQKTIQEMGRYDAAFRGSENWDRNHQMNVESMKLLNAARAGDVAGVKRNAAAVMDLLPASIGEPAKKYLKTTEALYEREPQLFDPVTGLRPTPNTDPYGPINVRATAGITDIDEGLAMATADFFVDLMRRNPELKNEIAVEIKRIDSANEWVHKWGRAQDQVVEAWIQKNDESLVSIGNAVDRVTAGPMPVPGVPLRLKGVKGFGSFADSVQAEKERRELQRLTRYGWEDSHSLKRMILLRGPDLGALFEASGQ
jgi:hypothetical protein